MGTIVKKVKHLIFILSLALLPATSRASPENDRVYQLESVAWLGSSDNMDGVFTEFVDEQFQRYFSAQTRFTPKPLKGISEILGKSSARYRELIRETEILKKISRKFEVESLIRTQVFKEGETYRFLIEWLYGPRAEVITQHEFRYVDEHKETGLAGGALPGQFQQAIGVLVSKLPFLGQVTGVEGDSITASLGRNAGIKPGDLLVISTLQSVRRHPVLGTIEEWRWQSVGRARVEQVEESLCFAKVVETESNQNVIRNHKVREIISAPPEKRIFEQEETFIARSGWVAGNAGAGIYARETSDGAGGKTRGGSGLLGVFELDTQIWINSRYLIQGSYEASLFSYSPTDLSTGSAIGTSVSGTHSRLRAALGTSLLPMKSLFDPVAWIHAGYKSTAHTLPTTADLTSKSSLDSVFVGVGGSFPVTPRLLAQLDLDLGIFRTADAADLGFGDASASSDLNFRLSGIYRVDTHFFFRVMLNIASQSMDFTAGQSVSQKSFSLSPSLMYYF
jgi:hypothetical protein